VSASDRELAAAVLFLQISNRASHEKWIAADYFTADPHSQKEPFTIVIPPPNVTGNYTLAMHSITHFRTH
jgi:valyl-tRNA synthetase